MAKLLNDEEKRLLLRSLSGWAVKDNVIYRKIEFKSFIEAFSFMTKVALLAEAMNHHPNWSNVYSTLTIELSTHDLGGISDLDIALAEKINKMLNDTSTIHKRIEDLSS